MTIETGTLSESLQAGDVRIVSANVINKKNQTIDVKNIVVELRIFENIFAPFITGSLMLSDASSLSSILPFVGEEMLVLEIETPTSVGKQEKNQYQKALNRVFVFHIYKMSGQLNITKKNKLYVLHFVSIEGFQDMNKAISQTFRGRISDLAKRFITNDKLLGSTKSAVVEDTNNNTIFTSNFWSPSKCLYYLTSRAINAINSPSYFFFENNEGFVFASLELMYNAPKMQSFIKDEKTRIGNNVPNIDEEYTRILDISSSDSVFDYIENKKLGAYGSTVYEVSLDRKALRKNILVKGDDPFSSSTKPNPNKVADPESDIRVTTLHRTLFNGYSNLAPTHESKRALILKNLQNITTNIQVLGRMDYTVGRMVGLTIYKDQSIDAATPDNQLEDELLSGDYLCTALCHIVTREKHITNMELMKATFLKKES